VSRAPLQRLLRVVDTEDNNAVVVDVNVLGSVISVVLPATTSLITQVGGGGGGGSGGGGGGGSGGGVLGRVAASAARSHVCRSVADVKAHLAAIIY
jgi:hypothetical protein